MFRQRIVMIGEKEGGLFVAVEIVSSDFGVCGKLHPAAGHDGAEDRELSESRSTRIRWSSLAVENYRSWIAS